MDVAISCNVADAKSSHWVAASLVARENGTGVKASSMAAAAEGTFSLSPSLSLSSSYDPSPLLPVAHGAGTAVGTTGGEGDWETVGRGRGGAWKHMHSPSLEGRVRGGW